MLPETNFSNFAKQQKRTFLSKCQAQIYGTHQLMHLVHKGKANEVDAITISLQLVHEVCNDLGMPSLP